MTAKTPSKPAGSASESREVRLKAALKANIARRKAQAKARGAAERPDESRKG
ncbi:MAG: hypothetical protein KDE00_09535 [Rhodobacteraceae bacterium]|nr:hypothetical protein [Paracoccaceae bacterium]